MPTIYWAILLGDQLANFEGLIRGAIAAKGASSPDQRQIVYESSRTALKKLIEANRSLTVEAAVFEQRSLEDAINNIELSYKRIEEGELPPDEAPTEVAPIPESPLVEAESVSPDEFEITPDVESAEEELVVTEELDQIVETASLPEELEAVAAENAPEHEPVQALPEAQENPFYELEQVLEGTVQSKPEEVPPLDTMDAIQEGSAADSAPSVPKTEEEQPDNQAFVPPPQVEVNTTQGSSDSIPPEFAERRKRQQKGLWFVAILILLAAIAWIGYRLFVGVVDGSLLGLNSGTSQGITQSGSEQDQSSNYITILEPGDLTALVVSDRGRVEIINEQSLEMIRLLSVRDKADRLRRADPILLRLKPGVVEQIRGKRVTVEVFARSGSSSPAQFAVECRFGENIGCGRKRFRVGVQPEASIFAFTLEEDRDINASTQIAINTDITDNAAITGEGDVLDIVYVRLRSAKQ